VSAAGYGGYVKLFDHWWTDGAIVSLMVDERYDAIVVFLAAIAYSHAHDTDGVLTPSQRALLERVNGIGTGAFDALIGCGLVLKRPGGKGGTHYEIRSYRKWQTMSEQRKDIASRGRARAGARVRSEEKRREEKRSARADASPHGVGAPRRDFDDSLSMDDLLEQARAKIIDLNARDRKDGTA